MRARMWIFLGLFAAMPAFAGPTLSKALRSQVPAEITAQTAVVEKDVATARAKADEYESQADTLDGSMKSQKLAIDTLEAKWKAEKERLKVAKKAKDKAARDSIAAGMDQIEAEIATAEEKLALTSFEADLRQAQADFLRSAADMGDADVQYVWATALFDANPEVDPVRFGEARIKAEGAYQRARADLAEAEAAYVAKGGQSQDLGKRDLTTMLSDGGRYATPPVSMVPESWTNTPAPAPAPAPVAPAPPSWTGAPTPTPAPAPAP